MTTYSTYVLARLKERKILAELRSRGIRMHVPTHKVRSYTGPHHARREIVREVPTAPGYGYASNLHADRLTLELTDTTIRRIGSSRGEEVRRLYPSRKKPQEAPQSRFQAGEKVRITNGPFAGHTATVEAARGTGWKVIASLFGKPCPLALADDYLEKVA
jgi:transcription antitermination factor NusG